MSGQTPLPRPTAISKPHWEGCREGKLMVQRCRLCERYIFIPQPVCNYCLEGELDWVQSSGRGTVYSFTEVHRPQRPEFAIPYTVAIIELEEGWHMLSKLVDCDESQQRVGQPVEVSFQKMSDDITLPMFRPRAGG